MERVPVDGDDRPEQDIKITGASVFVNPYEELEEEERKKAEAERKQASRPCFKCARTQQAVDAECLHAPCRWMFMKFRMIAISSYCHLQMQCSS